MITDKEEVTKAQRQSRRKKEYKFWSPLKSKPKIHQLHFENMDSEFRIELEK